MKQTLAFITLLVLGSYVAGCDMWRNNPKSLPPGQYERTSESTDSQGTTRTQKTTADVYYDEYGNKKAKVDQKTTTDPEGLFNKSTTETHTDVK